MPILSPPDKRSLAIMRLAPLILLFLIVSQTIFGQLETGTVFGKVTDDVGASVPGATILILGSATAVTAKLDGSYEINVPANKPIKLIFSSLNFFSDTIPVKVSPGQRLEQNRKLNINQMQVVDIIEEKNRDQPGLVLELENIDVVSTGPSQSIEAFLAGTGAVGTNNELSSSYTVRGGNFDENLVYVNDFEVFRPFLIRSGQQEGLSFINPNMVSKVYFSAGGFQPRYGDKMSSVLDVTYRKPKRKFGGSVSGSLLGAQAHLEGAIKSKKDTTMTKFTFLAGVRYRTLSYLLNSLETTGQYSPSFVDVQGLMTYRIAKRWQIEYLVNYASNKYQFSPVDRETTFGVVNQVLQLTMFFEGQENDSYSSFMNGISLIQVPTKHVRLKYMGAFYKTTEIEAFDILAEYFIGEVETDFSDDNFGQVRFGLGAGALQDFARNRLETQIGNFQWRGTYIKGIHRMEWGLGYQRENIKDEIREFERLDSAGYSLPSNGQEVRLDRVLRSKFNLVSNRFNGFVQDSWRLSDSSRALLTYGVRFSYWDVNKEFVVSPRVQFSISPRKFKKDVVFKIATGLYQQPPFYREMRALDGTVNTNLKAQKSFHAILGSDLNFQIWGRDFKFTTELYYKYMWDLVPYEFDNVLIRYFGQNQARGYAAGVELRLNGEFVKDTESYISISLMNAREDIEGDQFFAYFDENGDPVTRNSSTVVDSTLNFPGFIPRPSDQRVRFTIFFQDHLPRNENFKMHLRLVYATGLPFGPPDNERFRDVLRIPAYRRVDIGFSAQLYDQSKKVRQKAFGRALESAWLTLEIWNLLGVNNTVSYLWIKDFSNTVYAVPNFLTGRRFNLRLIVKF